MTVLETLEQNPLFKGFTAIGLKLFAGIAQERVIPAGTPLFVENMVGESMFVLKTGTVRLSQRVDGVERELSVVGPGEHLGALSLLGKTVRLVSAVAVTPCEVLELANRDFVRLQPEKPQACLKLSLAIAADMSAKFADARDLLQRLAVAR